MNLRAVPGVGALSAAKFIGEIAGVARFKSRHASLGTTALRPCRCGQATVNDTD